MLHLLPARPALMFRGSLVSVGFVGRGSTRTNRELEIGSDMSKNQNFALVLVVVGVLFAACSSDVTHSGVSDCEENQDCPDGVCQDNECIDGVECLDDDDCEVGTCDDEQCVALTLGEPCEEHEQCEGEICLEFEDEGKVCTESCEPQTDCTEDGSWTCGYNEEHRYVCKPDPGLPPADGSTFCGAGGVSQGGGKTLQHCVAPYDQGSDDLEGDGRRLESGGFKLNTQ